MKAKKLQDSGKRQMFSTGSFREPKEGAYHLFPGEALLYINKYKNNFTTIQNIKSKEEILNNIGINLFTFLVITPPLINPLKSILKAIYLIEKLIQLEDKVISANYKRLASHFEKGANKYAANNWRKGQPISRYFNSAFRHYLAIQDNKIDEDHKTAFYWNLIALIQTKLDIKYSLLPKELNDLPFTIANIFK